MFIGAIAHINWKTRLYIRQQSLSLIQCICARDYWWMKQPFYFFVLTGQSVLSHMTPHHVAESLSSRTAILKNMYLLLEADFSWNGKKQPMPSWDFLRVWTQQDKGVPVVLWNSLCKFDLWSERCTLVWRLMNTTWIFSLSRQFLTFYLLLKSQQPSEMADFASCCDLHRLGRSWGTIWAVNSTLKSSIMERMKPMLILLTNWRWELFYDCHSRHIIFIYLLCVSFLLFFSSSLLLTWKSVCVWTANLLDPACNSYPKADSLFCSQGLSYTFSDALFYDSIFAIESQMREGIQVVKLLSCVMSFDFCLIMESQKGGSINSLSYLLSASSVS